MSAFLRGVASMFDVFGSAAHDRLAQFPTDEEAIASDWRAVGDDLRRAMSGPAETDVNRLTWHGAQPRRFSALRTRFYGLPWEQQNAIRRGLWVLGGLVAFAAIFGTFVALELVLGQ